jgi:quercetin dioxygenase-like cupin family protein
MEAERLRLIRERAFAIWENEGRPPGKDLAHWLQAEHEASLTEALLTDILNAMLAGCRGSQEVTPTLANSVFYPVHPIWRTSMDRLEFETELRREGYRVVNSSVTPNLAAPNHCHDFDAKAFVLGGEITITRDNNPTTFRPGQCFEVPAGCMHAEQVGPEGVALLSGRRRNGGPLTREAFESDLRREGFQVVHGGQSAHVIEELHAHDFDARIMVLGGEITVTRDNKAETFQAGDHCEIPAGCQHSTKVGPEGVAYIVGKANRPASIN